jgi:hypothetical protein
MLSETAGNVEAIIAVSALLGLITVTLAALVGWRDWLALKARELDSSPPRSEAREIETRTPSGMARIEIADLKERIRKLEAIAAGVDI